MQDATVDRLAKLIADQSSGKSPDKNQRVQRQAGNIFAHFRLAEGWFTFFLLALVVYSTIWCVQVVGWVEHINLLTPITGLGLIFGVIAAKQRRIPRVLIHLLAVVLSLLFAFWQTSSADWAGQFPAFVNSMRSWLALAWNGGTSSDDSIFLFFILTLGFLLAYTSAWLVYRTRSPWLMLLANAVVLLINLSNIDSGYVIFLLLFLVAALLLLLRFNLYESSSRWKRQGLRCSDDLGWEFMQAGSLISLAILVFSWLLPWGYTNQQASQIWSSDNNPWVQAQNAWNRLLSFNGPVNSPNHGSFTNLLSLGGSPHLTNTPVFQLKTSDGTQYLMYSSYDQYDGSHSWFNSSQDFSPQKVNSSYSDQSLLLRQVTQTVQVVNPPSEQYAYIFGASQIVATNQESQLVRNKSDAEVVAWLRNNGKLAAGDVYTVVSYVSSADVETLRSVPMPGTASTLPPSYEGPLPATYFDPNILTTYTKLPSGLNSSIRGLALQITVNASTMYDKVTALEIYLRNHYTYDSTIAPPPPGAEAAYWFLFESKRGFCNYFATAMALMARELNIPARVAVGYTNGKYDVKTNEQDVSGTDAHAWTQIYFAGYGWVNFEPSTTFTQFARPIKATGTPGISVNPAGSPVTGSKIHRPDEQQGGGQVGTNLTNGGDSSVAGQIRQDVGIVLLVLIVFIVSGLLYFNLWWRRLFRELSPPAQAYGRIGLLAGWAGLASRRWQTPREYMLSLSTVVPDDAVVLERLGDIYTRECWADRDGPDHPDKTGETDEVPGIWKALQPRMMLYVLRHPRFLRTVPVLFGNLLRRPFIRRTRPGTSTVVIEERID
ncbi:MAG TPA: transglutaminase domain-containing protein [Ktedonobacteraceae bacterium]